MASSFVSDDMDKALVCCICFEPYIDPCIPKNLECGHVCCKECLKQLLSRTRKGVVHCPECRKQTPVPRGKIDNLPTNFPLKSLAEAEQKRQKTTRAPRPTTLRRRVTMLKKQAERPQQPNTDQDDEVVRLQLLIECLEQQLQQQQSPNAPQGENTPLGSSQPSHYMELATDNAVPPAPLTPPSQRPLPSPPLPERHRLSLPTGSRLSQENVGTHSAPSTPETAARIVPSHSRRSLPEAINPQMAPEPPAVNPAFQRKQLQPVDQFGSFEQAQGIAFTPDGLVAVCDFHKQIVSVFHKKKGKYLKKFELKLNSKNQSRPADVAVTTKGKFLVARRTAVELYTPKGKYERVLPNYHEETLGLCTVATTTDGRILVGDITNFEIIIYDPQGEAVLQTLKTDTKPARIAGLHGTLIAVSHARLGRLEVFDSSMNQSVQLFNIPEALGMCYDPHTSSILVVRNNRLDPGTVQRSTGVVEQYNIATGALTACLAEALFHPFNLAFAVNGMLAVTDKWTVKLFHIRDDTEPPIYE